MCGILFSLHTQPISEQTETCLESLAAQIERRGPTASSKLVTELPGIVLRFFAAVLHLRGEVVTQQPREDSEGNVFLWNGEVFGGVDVLEGQSDTAVMFAKLQSSRCDDEVLQLMSQVRGPWAFVFWQASSQKLWFGRDAIGRRSLLWRVVVNPVDAAHDYFALSSVAPMHEPHGTWVEVPVFGIFELDLSGKSVASSHFRLHPWSCGLSSWWNLSVTDNLLQAQPPGGVELFVPSAVSQSPQAAYYGDEQDDITNSTTIFTATRLLTQWPLDITSNRRLQSPLAFPTVFDNSLYDHQLDAHPEVDNDLVAKFRAVLEESVRRRVESMPRSQERVNLGVLFSGGIDCMVLTALIHKCLPPGECIDLFNVAFANKASMHRKDFSVPDRKTGLSGVAELRALCPDREFRFVAVDVPLETLQSQKEHLQQLVFPQKTVMDVSIGSSLWFAASAKGLIIHEDGVMTTPYTSSAKVLFSGVGADEQLAGYSRHRVAFLNYGWNGLESEVLKDTLRISERNCGRDDRVISDHGRELRMPFLDEDVVNFLWSLPLYQRAAMRYPRGDGEKRLLRALGRQIGLTNSTRLNKRAIQFGSRIAKLENNREQGSDVA